MKYCYTILIIAFLCSCKYRTGIEPQTLSSEYTSSLEVSTYGHKTSLLSNSKVFLSGSSSDGFSHEMYSPELRLWESLPNSPISFEHHGLMPLKDGRILLAGGYQRENATVRRTQIGARVQLFDPATHTWTSATSMNIKRASFSLVPLDNGTIMAAGGYSPTEIRNRVYARPTATVEFYDPTTDTWTLGPSMQTVHADYEPIKLPDGRVLILGGNVNAFSGEIYNPAINTWSAISVPSVDVKRGYRAVLADDDHVILTGGIKIAVEGSKVAAIYTISEDSWKLAAEMKEERSEHSLLSLGNGKILAIGGNGTLDDHPFYPTVKATASCEVYDMESDSWRIIGNLQIARARHESIQLSPSEILSIGRNPLADQGAELQFLK